MTYKLAFNESALKEWKKLGHTIQEQFKKKFRNKGYCPHPLMLILGKTGSIICTGFILFIPALHPA